MRTNPISSRSARSSTSFALLSKPGGGDAPRRPAGESRRSPAAQARAPDTADALALSVEFAESFTFVFIMGEEWYPDLSGVGRWSARGGSSAWAQAKKRGQIQVK